VDYKNQTTWLRYAEVRSLRAPVLI
jgi:hypothetical protein